MAGLKFHHLNCGTFCPFGGKLVNSSPARMVCHCLLVETPRNGLLLVDTGLGEQVMNGGEHLLELGFKLAARPRLEPNATATAQLKKLGFDPSDVRHVVLTHMDVDHAGGLREFPGAEVHVFRREHQEAMSPTTIMGHRRYPKRMWSHGPKWVLHGELGDLPSEILLVPLVGHTPGHCGVALESESGWIMHAGDAYFHSAEMESEPHCPPGLVAFQNIMQWSRRERLRNPARLRTLVRAPDERVRVFCAHDPSEFDRSLL